MQRTALVAAVLAAGLSGFAPRAAVGASTAPRSAAKTAGCCDCAVPPARPITLRTYEGRDGWELHFELPPYAGYTDVFARFDDRPEANVGHEHVLDVMTGKPRVRTWIIVPQEWATPGAHRVSLRLTRIGGRVDRRLLSFDAARERLAVAKRYLANLDEDDVSFSEHGDEVTWLAFTHLYSHRRSLREVRYSVDDCTLHNRIVFAADPDVEPTLEPPPAQSNDLILDRPFLSLPKVSTASACVQVVFRDGASSNVLEIRRQAGGGR
ncbi:MAG TPA: hypothetical protein VFS60_06005 [Thermoanaerobaculia bacterium]|nr:hypothetical protein [Thermoanaerobaculia bacterium]